MFLLLVISLYFVSANDECAKGFMEYDLLEQKASQISTNNGDAGDLSHQQLGKSSDDRQYVMPSLSLSCSGVITGFLLGADIRIDGSSRDQYPSIQLFTAESAEPDSYKLVSGSQRDIVLNAANFSTSGLINYTLSEPLEFNSSHMLGAYQPPHTNSRVILYYQSFTGQEIVQLNDQYSRANGGGHEENSRLLIRPLTGDTISCLTASGFISSEDIKQQAKFVTLVDDVEQGVDIFYEDIGFNCNGNITKVIVGMESRSKSNPPEIRIWRSNGDTYTQSGPSIQLYYNEAAQDVSADYLRWYNLSEPVSVQEGDVLGIYQPTSNVADSIIYHQEYSGPVNYYGNNMPTGFNYYPLVSVEFEIPTVSLSESIVSETASSLGIISIATSEAAVTTAAISDIASVIASNNVFTTMATSNAITMTTVNTITMTTSTITVTTSDAVSMSTTDIVSTAKATSDAITLSTTSDAIIMISTSDTVFIATSDAITMTTMATSDAVSMSTIDIVSTAKTTSNAITLTTSDAITMTSKSSDTVFLATSDAITMTTSDSNSITSDDQTLAGSTVLSDYTSSNTTRIGTSMTTNGVTTNTRSSIVSQSSTVKFSSSYTTVVSPLADTLDTATRIIRQSVPVRTSEVAKSSSTAEQHSGSGSSSVIASRVPEAASSNTSSSSLIAGVTVIVILAIIASVATVIAILVFIRKQRKKKTAAIANGLIQQGDDLTQSGGFANALYHFASLNSHENFSNPLYEVEGAIMAVYEPIDDSDQLFQRNSKGSPMYMDLEPESENSQPQNTSHSIYESPETFGDGTMQAQRETIALKEKDMHSRELTNSKYENLKTGFFTEEPIYWDPGNNTKSIYEQLAQKKYKEIARHEIRILEHLGSGQFGAVDKGVWDTPKGSVEVAIKTLKGSATEDEELKFLQEAAINGQFHHPNVVQLCGVVTVGQPIMIVLEYITHGDLKSFLEGIRPAPGELADDSLPILLLKFSHQVACGMAYLSSKKFVHRDLAARNVLVSNGTVCKIADFGMSRNLQDEAYYTSNSERIPVKWTAPEAIYYRKYSTQSDVWSYGAVLYEIWSVGHKPFEEHKNQECIELVESGYRLPAPSGCPRAIYEIMINCWHPVAASRPSFEEIKSILSQEKLSASLHSVSSLGMTDVNTEKGCYPELQNKYQ